MSVIMLPLTGSPRPLSNDISNRTLTDIITIGAVTFFSSFRSSDLSQSI